jgi:hypothetical protein
MKNILNYEGFINENKNPSLADLAQFMKDFVNGNTDLQLQRKHYKIDTEVIRKLVNKLILTSQLKEELIKRKIEVPDISKLKYNIDSDKYHKSMLYELYSDSLDKRGESRFVVSIEIKIPHDKSFEDDNTLISATIYIARHGKFKELSSYSNKRAQKDKEFNYYSIGEVLQKSYRELVESI